MFSFFKKRPDTKPDQAAETDTPTEASSEPTRAVESQTPAEPAAWAPIEPAPALQPPAPPSEGQASDASEPGKLTLQTDANLVVAVPDKTPMDVLFSREIVPSTVTPELSWSATIASNRSEPVGAVESMLSETSGQSQALTEQVKTGGFLSRLKQGLSRTRENLAEGLNALVSGRKTIDDALLEEIETQLLTADVGIEATDQVIASLTAKLKRKQLKDADALMESLQAELRGLLEPCSVPLKIDSTQKPYVILVVGVNGVGKTTTIGKLARRFQNENHKVMLAAGDTFRAAAVEQLQAWGDRNKVPVVAQSSGSDSASVIFDAYQSAKARGIDVLIADTAGRLHNKTNLMQELQKIVRVLKKLDDNVPHEVMLVLDATTGQNALNQARSFNDAVKITGLCLTKLDGTAKGGVVFAIAKALALPIRFIGIGEQAEDLRPFNADDFVAALFNKTEDSSN